MHHHLPRRLAATLFAAVTLPVSAVTAATAPSASAQPSTTTTAAKATKASLAYSARGPYAVGYRELSTTGAQQSRLTLRAWYPAPRAGQPTVRTINYTAPNKMDEQITPGKQITSVGTAIANSRVERSGEPYPLIVFSHGYAISPILYSTLVEHWASHGFIVLAPEHNERFDQSLDGFWKALIDRPVDIRRTIDQAERFNKPGATFAGLIDLSRIAVVGHSYGGYTALAAAGARFDFDAYTKRCAALPADDPLNFFCGPVIPRAADMAKRAGLPAIPKGLWRSQGDPRIKAAISMAGDAYPFNQRGLSAIKVPLMSMGGTVDDGTPYTWGAKLSYDHAGSTDKSLVTFPGAGHMIFLDPCDNLPWTQRSVYRDGYCKDAVWGAGRPLDVVEHYSTAFLFDTLNNDRPAHARLTGKQPILANVAYETTQR